MTDGLPPKVQAYVSELESLDPEALVAVFDRDGYYLYASPNHRSSLGYTSGELQSMHLSQVVVVSDHHAAWVLRTVAVFRSRPIPFSSRLVSKAGELVRVSGTLLHLRTSELDRYFVTSVHPA